MTLVQPVISKALIGYAVLRANFNHDAPSYVDNFSNFVLDVVSSVSPQSMDAADVARAVHSRFGLVIPDRVVGTLLKRGVSRGQIVKTESGYALDGLSRASANDARLSSQIVQFGRQQTELSTKFVEFIARELPEHLHLIRDDAPQVLEAFVDTHSVPLLALALRGGKSPDSTSDRHLRGPEYLASAFIAHLVQHDNVAFGYLVEAVKGAILAAVLEMGTDGLRTKLSDLTLILDTPFLLKALVVLC